MAVHVTFAFLLYFAITIRIDAFFVDNVHVPPLHCDHHKCSAGYSFGNRYYGSVCWIHIFPDEIEGKCLNPNVTQQIQKHYQKCTNLLLEGDFCYCTSQECIDFAFTTYQFGHKGMTTTTPRPMTSSTTPRPTFFVPAEYPDCNHENCAHLYLPYCHLYVFNNELQGRCMPFKVGSNCLTFDDIAGNGCTCSTTNCSRQVLNEYNQRNPALSTTTEMTFTTNTQTPTTKEGSFECFGDTCDISKRHCHIFEYNNQLTARCMPFNLWKACTSYEDVSGTGCTCTTTSCGRKIANHESYVWSSETPTVPSTAANSEVTTALTSEKPSNLQTITNVEGTTTIRPSTTTQLTQTTAYTVPTTESLCADKPGVDCVLLNTTNICANPFSNQYCAAFCGHCKTDSVQTTFG